MSRGEFHQLHGAACNSANGDSHAMNDVVDVAEYIADVTFDLHRLAKAFGLGDLASSLETTYNRACHAVTQPD